MAALSISRYARPTRLRAAIICILLTALGVVAQDYNTSKPNIKGPYGFEVNSFTGNLFCGRQDISIPGRGLDLDLAFSYNSLHRLRNYGFGYGWSCAYSMAIEPDSAGVWLRRMDGKRDLFRAQGGLLIAPIGVFDALQQTSPGIYRLTAKDGAKFFFQNATHKRLTRIEDRYGNAIQLSYTDSLLTGMQDATGRAVTLSYTGGLLSGITTQTTPARSVTYGYDASGNLTNVTDALGQTMIYAYDDGHRIIGMADRNANPLSIGYDGNGACIRMASCLGEMKVYYDQVNRKTHLTEEVEGEHQLTTFQYDVLGRLTKQEGNCCGYNTSFEYDAVGNITKRVNGNGNATQYSYDARGNLTQEIDAMGKTMIYAYEPVFNQLTSITDRRGNTTSFTYDSNGKLLSVARPLGITESFTYDAFGQRLTYTDARSKVYQYAYNPNGYLLSITDPEAGVTAMTYDGVGNLLTETTPNGHATTFAYDVLDRLTTITDPLTHQTQLVYDAKENVNQVTDALGRQTLYDYDPLDRLMNEQNALGQVTQYRFDAKGNLRRIIDPLGFATQMKYDKQNRLKEAINALGESTKYEYDGAGNVTMVQRPDGNTITFDYDPLSRLVAVQDVIGAVKSFTYDENSNSLSESDGLGNAVSYGYDALNRMVSQTDPLGSSAGYTFDAAGNILTYTDRMGHVTSYTYDDLNRRLTETDAINAVKQFAYDANGNLASVTDQNGNVTSYAYNANDDLLTETYPDASTRSFTYDAVRNPLTRTDNNGVTTNYVYDAANRLTSRNYPGNISDQFVYDLKGRMTQANNATVNVSFSYDPLDRLLAENMGGQVIGFAYDTPGRMRQVNYPGGRKIQELMDVRGRLTRITDATGTAYVVAEQTYDLADRKTSRNYANGTNSQWTYDANSRITNIVHGPGAFASFTYGHDDEDNRLYEQRNHAPAQSKAYSYDNLLRLTGATTGTLVSGNIPSPTGSELFNYDPLGNRITSSLNGVNTSYLTNNLNQYTSYTSGNTTNLSYDANGNLTQEGSRTYQYDKENRLIGVDGGSTGNYGYDALGRRVKKVVGGIVLWYFHDGVNVIEEQNGAYSTVSTRAFGKQVDEIIQQNYIGSSYYYAQDALISTHAITNSSGVVIERYAYGIYGEAFIVDGNGTPLLQSAVGNDFLFAGRTRDAESDFYFNRNRFLSTTEGRFIQRDPLAFVDGFGLYQYARSNPIMLVDPFGLASSETCPVPCSGNYENRIGCERENNCGKIGQFLSSGPTAVWQSVSSVASVWLTGKSNFFITNGIYHRSPKRSGNQGGLFHRRGGRYETHNTPTIEKNIKAGKLYERFGFGLGVVDLGFKGVDVWCKQEFDYGDLASVSAAFLAMAPAAGVIGTVAVIIGIGYTVTDLAFETFTNRGISDRLRARSGYRTLFDW